MSKHKNVFDIIPTIFDLYFRFYNSFMDNPSNLQYVFANGSTIATDSVQYVLASIAVSLAETLYTLIKPEVSSKAVEPPIAPVATLVCKLQKSMSMYLELV